MRRPATEGGPLDELAGRAGSEDTADTRQFDIPAQLRRRRSASSRCQPLDNGHRDPLDPPPQSDGTVWDLESWAAAAAHLRAHRLYGRWQLPADVLRATWYRQRRQSCRCGGTAS